MTNTIKHLSLNKYALALHTTTPELGLAVSNFANHCQSQVWNLGRDLSSHIHQYLVEFIKPKTWADLEFIAVAKGPGGFTGTRIGVVTARTLGQQLKIPVFTVSTLAAVAWQEYNSYDSSSANQVGNSTSKLKSPVIAVEMPAQRGQIFGAIYQPNSDNSGITALLPDTVFTPGAWQEVLAVQSSLGDSNYQLISATSHLAATVNSILELAYLDWLQGQHPHWSQALPYYGQFPVDQ